LEDKIANKNDVNNKLTKDEGVGKADDPLDSFMKTIADDASMQDYEYYQMYYNQQLQKKYDDFAEKDGNDYDENVRDDVKMIEDDDNYGPMDSSKVITLEEILKNCKASTENENNDNDDKDHKNGNYNNNGKIINSRDNGKISENTENEENLGNTFNNIIFI